MKNIIIISLLVFLFASCTHVPGNKSVTEGAQDSAYQGLIAESQRKDSTISSFIQSFNEIEDNLSVIKEKQKIVTVSSKDKEIQKSKQDQIVEDIKTINDLMVKNKEKVASLNSRLKKGELKMAEFQKMIDRLNTDLAEKDSEIVTLQGQLVSVNSALKNLFNDYNDRVKDIENKDEVIAQKTEEINTGWYAFGTSKELKEHGVISKEGGFIGIGRNKKLVQNFNKDYFKKIDVTSTTSIPLECKKATLITTHPVDSYKFEGTGRVDKLIITDPKNFWAASKYLVVVVD